MVELLPKKIFSFRVSYMSQTCQRDFMHLLFPTSVGILERLDFTSMRLRLGGCLYVHTGELQNKCFAEFT